MNTDEPFFKKNEITTEINIQAFHVSGIVYYAVLFGIILLSIFLGAMLGYLYGVKNPQVTDLPVKTIKRSSMQRTRTIDTYHVATSPIPAVKNITYENN